MNAELADLLDDISLNTLNSNLIVNYVANAVSFKNSRHNIKLRSFIKLSLKMIFIFQKIFKKIQFKNFNSNLHVTLFMEAIIS